MVITFEERVMEQLVEDMSGRAQVSMKPLLVLNIVSGGPRSGEKVLLGMNFVSGRADAGAGVDQCLWARRRAQRLCWCSTLLAGTKKAAAGDGHRKWVHRAASWGRAGSGGRRVDAEHGSAWPGQCLWQPGAAAAAGR